MFLTLFIEKKLNKEEKKKLSSFVNDLFNKSKEEKKNKELEKKEKKEKEEKKIAMMKQSKSIGKNSINFSNDDDDSIFYFLYL